MSATFVYPAGTSKTLGLIDVFFTFVIVIVVIDVCLRSPLPPSLVLTRLSMSPFRILPYAATICLVTSAIGPVLTAYGGRALGSMSPSSCGATQISVVDCVGVLIV